MSFNRSEISLFAIVVALSFASPVMAQDGADTSTDQELLDAELLDNLGLEVVDVDVSVAERELPSGVVRVRTDDGQYLPPFELQQACSGDWCGEVVINALSGEVLFAQGRWQPGALETGYGQEVVVAVEQ